LAAAWTIQTNGVPRVSFTVHATWRRRADAHHSLTLPRGIEVRRSEYDSVLLAVLIPIILVLFSSLEILSTHIIQLNYESKSMPKQPPEQSLGNAYPLASNIKDAAALG